MYFLIFAAEKLRCVLERAMFYTDTFFHGSRFRLQLVPKRFGFARVKSGGVRGACYIPMSTEYIKIASNVQVLGPPR